MANFPPQKYPFPKFLALQAQKKVNSCTQKVAKKNPIKLHRKYVEFLSRHRGKRSNFYNEHRGEKKIQEKKKN